MYSVVLCIEVTNISLLSLEMHSPSPVSVLFVLGREDDLVGLSESLFPHSMGSFSSQFAFELLCLCSPLLSFLDLLDCERD